MAIIDVIIPTFDNPNYVYPCVESLLTNKVTEDLIRIIVVNNGHPDSVKGLEAPDVTILNAGRNLGWEGGLKLGLAQSKAPFVVFCNDDIIVPTQSKMWPNILLQHFRYPDCAAVGPSSNCVTGLQSMFVQMPYAVFRTSFLIGFFMMVRREHLDLVGGVNDALPYHGDDIDLSIRLRQAGKYLVANREIFIFHHGFKTGQRENGAYWNSSEMQEKTNFHLINTYGLPEWYQTMNKQFRSEAPEEEVTKAIGVKNLEQDVVRKYIQGENILELGCGAAKTVSRAVGVDFIPNGERIPGLFHEVSEADIVADVSEPLPDSLREFDTVIARHVLEHMLDPVKVVRQWGRTLKEGGRLIVAVPDQNINNTIPLNFQHVHAYTPDSLKTFMESQGWKTEALEDVNNYISFVGVFKKNGVHP